MDFSAPRQPARRHTAPSYSMTSSRLSGDRPLAPIDRAALSYQLLDLSLAALLADFFFLGADTLARALFISSLDN
jgi:hypothetical protein